MLLAIFGRFLGRKSQTESSNDDDSSAPEIIVVRIQNGDVQLRNQFITDYQPYIAKVTSRFCKRYIDPARDDEFSVALSAFNEAINQFVPDVGRSFLGFAETVVRRRLIDYVRKEQKFKNQAPLSSFDVEDDESNVVNPVEIQQAMDEYGRQLGAEERRHEIDSLSQQLAEFAIDFSDFISNSPKHVDSREMLFSIARVLSDDEHLMTLLLAKKMLPIKELLPKVAVSRKTLERNRKYIIMLALVYQGSFPYLRDYLQLSTVYALDHHTGKEASQ